MRTCRRLYASIEEEGAAEDVEAAGEVEEEVASSPRVVRRGINVGNAVRVAVVRCWLDVRRHVLNAWRRVSGSGIYSTTCHGHIELLKLRSMRRNCSLVPQLPILLVI